MSEFGLRVRNPSNLAPWFDSRQAIAGVPLDFISLPAGAASFACTYPTSVGRPVRFVSMDLFSAVGAAAVDYALGCPRLTATSVPFPQAFMLMGFMSTFGLRIRNPGMGLVVASDGFGLNCLGKASLVAYERLPT